MVHRHNDSRPPQPHKGSRLVRAHGETTSHRHEKDIGPAERVHLGSRQWTSGISHVNHRDPVSYGAKDLDRSMINSIRGTVRNLNAREMDAANLTRAVNQYRRAERRVDVVVVEMSM